MKAHWVLVAVLAFAIALILILASPALANGDGQTRYACPGGGYTLDPGWAAVGCGKTQPAQPGGNSSSDATAGAVGVGVGVGTGIGVGTGGAGGAGGQGGSGGQGGGGGNAVAEGGAGGAGGNAAGGSATGGTSFGSNQQQSAAARTGNISLSNNSRAAASSSIAPQLGGYGLPNCFGDTNPSGSFVAAYQGLLFGASGGSMKASNICAVYAIGGEEAAMRYLMRMDPALAGGPIDRLFRRPAQMVITQPTGRVVCPASHPVYVEGRGCRQ